MRHSFSTTLAITATILCVSCDAAVDPRDAAELPALPPFSDAVLPDSVRSAYRDDAVRLALRHLQSTGSPARADVRPPMLLVRTLLDALAHVYAYDHGARDLVIETHRIHTFPNPPIYEIIVGVDPSHAWVREWQSGNRLTGKAAVDVLMSQYHLTVEQYYSWSFGHAVVLRAAEPLNAEALARRFSGIDGVNYAEGNGYAGDGNDIRARVEQGGWRLDYSVGSGDCLAGCIERTTWSFHVQSNGTVRYLGES